MLFVDFVDFVAIVFSGSAGLVEQPTETAYFLLFVSLLLPLSSFLLFPSFLLLSSFRLLGLTGRTLYVPGSGTAYLAWAYFLCFSGKYGGDMAVPLTLWAGPVTWRDHLKLVL